MLQAATDQEANWLDQYFQRASISDSNKISSITRFALIWNLFEGEVCHGSFSIPQIEDVLQELSSRDNLRVEDFEPHLTYFRERYVTGGATNHLYQGLNFRRNDREPLVASVLRGVETNPTLQVLALTIIVYRLRNNLFHGIKSLYSLGGQVENFHHANAILMRIIDLSA